MDDAHDVAVAVASGTFSVIDEFGRVAPPAYTHQTRQATVRVMRSGDDTRRDWGVILEKLLVVMARHPIVGRRRGGERINDSHGLDVIDRLVDLDTGVPCISESNVGIHMDLWRQNESAKLAKVSDLIANERSGLFSIKNPTVRARK